MATSPSPSDRNAPSTGAVSDARRSGTSSSVVWSRSAIPRSASSSPISGSCSRSGAICGSWSSRSRMLLTTAQRRSAWRPRPSAGPDHGGDRRAASERDAAVESTRRAGRGRSTARSRPRPTSEPATGPSAVRSRHDDDHDRRRPHRRPPVESSPHQSRRGAGTPGNSCVVDHLFRFLGPRAPGDRRQRRHHGSHQEHGDQRSHQPAELQADDERDRKSERTGADAPMSS